MTKTKSSANEGRIHEIESTLKIYKKEIEGLLMRQDEFRKQMLSCDADRISLRSKIYDLTKVKPFTDVQLKKLKNICDHGWDDFRTRLAKIHVEVFEQVMEQEMALAKIESVELDQDQFKRKSTKSLIMRMQSFKTSLVAKQQRNEAAVYESSESITSSIMEEESSMSN